MMILKAVSYTIAKYYCFELTMSNHMQFEDGTKSYLWKIK